MYDPALPDFLSHAKFRYADNQALGNIFTTPLKDILAGERSVRFIEGFRAKRAVEPLCQHCSFKERFSHKM